MRYQRLNSNRQFALSNSEIRELIIDGYAKWVRDKLSEGWDAYLLSFTFSKIPGDKTAISATMLREIQWVYATMLTRIVRNPMSASKRDSLPIWIASPDFPVPKYIKQSLREVTINDGLHYHAICLIPPDSRLKNSLEDHVEEHQELYRGKTGTIRKLDVRFIATMPEFVTDYMLKSLKTRRVDESEIIIFPRSPTELKDVSGNWAELYRPEEKYVTMRVFRIDDRELLF